MFEIKPGKPKAKNKNLRPLATAVDEKKHKVFEEIATENNLTKSELLRQIVEQFLKENKRKDIACDECGLKPMSKTENENMFQSGLCDSCSNERR